MFSMFSPDSKIMQILSRVTDLVLLNILYLISCLPLFTIGAANTAMYTVCFRMLREEEGGIVKGYFRAFRDNFKQGTLLWLIALFVVLPGAYYLDRLYTSEGPAHFLYLVIVLVLAVAALTCGYAFPWAARFQNRTADVLRNGLLLAISHLPRSLCIAAINLLPLALWAMHYDLFLKISFLWLALYFAAAAYMNAALLHPVFKPYITE